jgi:uncharacterized membrane protein YphA (DoxX/SURF4 family)
MANSANIATTAPKLDVWYIGKLVLIFFRVMLGAWMIVNGTNHILYMLGLPPINPQPLGTLHWSNVMLVSLIETHLFDLIKICELLTGLCLVFNIFVPLALAIALPISYMVFHNSIFLNYRYDRIFSTYMAVWCLYMNVILMFAYAKYYVTFCKMHAPMGKMEDLKLVPSIFDKSEQG